MDVPMRGVPFSELLTRGKMGSMKKVLRKILIPIGVIWFISLFIAAFMAYFVSSVGPNGIYDGLGRSLTDTLLLVRIFFGEERMWTGWKWFISDMIIFWGSIALAANIGKYLEDRERPPT
jgi:hypothetical protein